MPGSLDPAQIRRYARHILLPDIGGVGQRRLLASTVVIAVRPGDGAAVCALAYLAAAGVGRIVLTGDAAGPVTADEVPRCILYGHDDVHRPRVQAIAERVAAINPDVTIEMGELGERGELGEQVLGQALPPGAVALAPPPEDAVPWLCSEHPDEAAAADLARGGMQAVRTLMALIAPAPAPSPSPAGNPP